MPLADARYDVIFNDGSGRAVGGGPKWEAVIDMAELRLPDDWGDPGPLLWADLVAWRSPHVKSIAYAPARDRMALWVDGWPRMAKARRQYLRWAVPDEDPPPHDDPDWVLPP